MVEGQKKRKHKVKGFWTARLTGTYQRFESYREFREAQKKMEKERKGEG